MRGRPPMQSNLVAPLLKNAFFRGRQLSDDRCMFLLNRNHLRPTPISSLYFLMGVCLAPQTGEPTASSAHPASDALRGYFGSHHDMSWWHRWPTMEVEGKATGGKAAAAHVGCCVFCVLCCGVSGLVATNDTYFVESQYRIGQNGQVLHAHRQKYITKPPKCQGNVKVLRLEDTGLGVKMVEILSPPLKTVDLKKSHVIGTNYREC